jgi:hypothetical protein
VISNDKGVPSNTLFLSLSEQYILNNETKDLTQSTNEVPKYFHYYLLQIKLPTYSFNVHVMILFIKFLLL